MKSYNNGQRKYMMYGGATKRKPMMYGGMATTQKKKKKKNMQMGGKANKPENMAGSMSAALNPTMFPFS